MARLAYALFLTTVTTAGARERFSPCPNSCSGHGLCDAWHVCHCADTYQGADCSQRTCPYGPAWADHPEQITGDGVGHQPAECSRRGNCDRLGGTCVCGVGFEGAACERRACGPLLCTGRGVCRSLRDKALRRDLGDSRSSLSHFHSADPPFSAPVQTYNAWDATMMHGCDCDKGFWGPNCEFVECPRGDDPYTSGSRVVQQMLVCMGDGGSVALSFRGATTRPLAWDSSSAIVRAALLELPTLRGGAGDEAFGDQREMLPRPLNAQLTGRAVSVLYDNGATTLCAASGVTAIIQFNQDFGDIPLLVPDATDLTHSSIIISPSLAVALKQTSDKEDAVCSNRGLCDPLSGRCACDGEFWGSSDGYGMRGSRGDCGVAVNLASITGCPGDIPCNGHGVCDEETFACGCEEGWRAADCSERTCPYGPAWYAYPTATDVAHVTREECSGMGTCDRTLGVCFCQDGFSGAACDVLACPGETAPCSGHGQCLTMQQLAQANGFTYRSTPDDPYTWDADAVQGCRCDEGYRGYDCSLRFCPFGDDPLTTAVVDSKECSGRGLCDEMTGTCVCMEGFGSSDGAGKKGEIQDCGYKLPLSAPVI